MNKKQLLSKHEMPGLGLGTWQLKKDTENTVLRALELGYRLIDTSSDYGTQPAIGKAVNKSGIPRNELFITTKVEEDDDAYERTLSNLQELGLEFVDLMLIHRPPSSGAGQDLWEGLIRAKEEGLVKDIGVSNYSIDLIEDLIESSGETPAVNQIEWSPFGHSDRMLQYARSQDMFIQAYSPLTRAKRLNDERLVEIAESYGKTPAQILLRWNIQIGTVPLPKANQEDHLKENLDVFDFEIEERDLAELRTFNEEYSSLGSLPYV